MYRVQIKILIISVYFFLYLSAQETVQINSEDYGDRLKLGFVWQGEVSFNPFLLNYDYDKELNNLLFGNGLFKQSNNGEIIKNLVLDGGLLNPTFIRYKLRSDLVFHDGSPLTAEDVLQTLELYKKFAYQSPTHFNARLIDYIEVYGNDIVRIKLKQPVPDFLTTLGLLPILSKDICKSWSKYNSIYKLPRPKLSGIGKFKFIEYTPQKTLNLDSYFSHSFGPSYLSGIDFVFFDNQERLLEAFLNEEIDLIQIQDKSEIQKILQFSKKIVQLGNKEKSLYYLNLNTKKFPFNDFGIRKAINYAINKNQMLNYLTFNIETDGFLELNTMFSEESKYFTSYEYKPLESLQILNSNQYKKNNDGILTKNNKDLKFELNIANGSLFDESIARMIAINLGDLGINTLPISMDADELNNRFNQGNYQAILRKFDFNPENINETLRNFYLFELNTKEDYKNFKNFSLEIILDYAESAKNNSRLNIALNRFQNLLFRYSPCIILFFKKNKFYAVNSRFENIVTVRPDTQGNLLNFLKPKDEWFVKNENHKY